jgi:hypothetical protein
MLTFLKRAVPFNISVVRKNVIWTNAFKANVVSPTT